MTDLHLPPHLHCPPHFRDVEPRTPAFYDCDFYHTTTLPSGEMVRGQWDLRDNVQAYLGGVEFAGKSVLEIGPASGFLSYHMERSGALVTAIEPSLERLWDCVPMPGIDFDAWRQAFLVSIQRVRNSFWYLHRQYGSSIRVVETDPETLPAEVGEFDVGVFASMLLHCRSPFSILEGCLAQVRETVIVTDLHDSAMDGQPVCRLLPDVRHKQIDTWWALSPDFVVQALGVLGFGNARVTTHHQKRDIDGQMIPLFTVVATRNVPMPPPRKATRPGEECPAPRQAITQRPLPLIPPAQRPLQPDPGSTDPLQGLLTATWDGLLGVPQRLGLPSGWWGHVPFACWLVEACQPAMLVELGTHHGVSYAAFCESVLRQGLLTRCYAIDHWRGDQHSGCYDDSVYEDLKRFNELRYGAFSELIRRDFSAAAEEFADGSIDLLHIDGLHTYEAVAHDFGTWLPKLSRRGVVLLHDTNVYRDDFGVHRLFRELSQQYPSFEFLHGNGLGVLACGAEVPEAIGRLCQPDDQRQILAVRERFARLGFTWELQAREHEHRSAALAAARMPAKAQAAILGEQDAAQTQVQRLQQQVMALQRSVATQALILEERDAAHVQVQRLQQQVVALQRSVATQALILEEREAAHVQVQRLQQQVEALQREVAETHQSSSLRVAAAEEQGLRWEGVAREITQERDGLMQSLYDLQSDSTAQQQRCQQQIRIYDQIVTDLLRRHAEEVDFENQPQHEERHPAIPRLLAWCRSQLPVSLPSGLQFARPLLHHLLIGINPVAKVVARSTLFDREWYLAQNPDIAALGAHPAYHYTVIGARTGRDPGPWFSTRRYLALHPELVGAGVNPLYHFEMVGRKAGRPLGLSGDITMTPVPAVSGVPILPAQEATPLPSGTPAPGDKAWHVEQARHQLRAFLADAGNRLTFPPQPAPVVSIVVVMFNNAALNLQCLMSIHAQQATPLELIVVDNASSDETTILLGRLEGCTVLRQQENLHFLRAANVGARAARGRHLLFLNNDTTLGSQALAEACGILDREADVGAVGGKILLLDGSLQEAGSIIWQDGSTSGYGRGADPLDPSYQFQRDVDYCSGAFLMVRRAVFDQLGGFDPLFAPAYYEDADLCARIWEAGLRVVYSPRIQIVHVESASYGADGSINRHIVNNRERFKHRHAVRLQRAWARQTTDELLARLAPGRYSARVLFIDDCWPLASLGSGLPRARELLSALCKGRVFVTHYATNMDNAVPAIVQDALAKGVERITGGLSQLSPFLHARAAHYNCLIVSRPHNMQAVSAWLELQPEAAGRLRVVYDAEAVVAPRDLLLSQARPRAPAPAMSLRDEMSLTRKADTIVAVNEAEAGMFRSAGRTDVRVLGHCVDVDLSPAPFESRTNLLFVGRLAEMDSPNVDAVEWFIEYIMPLLNRQLGNDYCVDLVGLCADELRHRYAHHGRLRFHGRIDDLTPHYANARLFIAPTRFAAGIPIKVYEAAARGVPVVTTSLLGRQLGWVDGESIMLADSPQAFAQACAALYHDVQRWSAIREAAVQRVRHECGRPAFLQRVQDLLAGLLTPHSGDSPSASAVATAPPSGRWNRTAAEWSRPPEERSREHGMFWMAHPWVAQRLNTKISDDPQIGTYPYLKSLLQQRGLRFPVSRAASLGSGFGGLERELVALAVAERIDGFDLSADAVAAARQGASQAGMSERLRYQICNLEQIQLASKAYDLIVACHSVHHIDDLDRLFSQVRAALKPGGVFCLEEYVGPNRFQWNDRQLDAANDFLRGLPAHYKRMPNGEARGEAFRPAVADVIAVDPTEAIRSADILPTLRRHFQIVAMRQLGGAVLHNALYGIAQNFDPEVAEDRQWLDALFNQEDRLMAEGVLGSDFAVIVAAKPRECDTNHA